MSRIYWLRRVFFRWSPRECPATPGALSLWHLLLSISINLLAPITWDPCSRFLVGSSRIECSLLSEPCANGALILREIALNDGQIEGAQDAGVAFPLEKKFERPLDQGFG